MTEHVFYHEHVFGVKYTPEMRASTVTALAYATLAVIFVALWKSDWGGPLESDGIVANLFAGAVLVQPVTGFVVPRLWALALPFIALAVVLPFSEPDPELMGVTDAGAMFLGGFFAMILVAFGIACRLTLDMLREPR